MRGRDCDIKCKHAMDVTPNWRAKCSKVLQDIHGIVTKWSNRISRSSTHFCKIPQHLLMTTTRGNKSLCRTYNRVSIY